MERTRGGSEDGGQPHPHQGRNAKQEIWHDPEIKEVYVDIAIAISCFVIHQSRSPPVQRRFVWPTNLGSSDREDATLDSAPFVRNWRTWNRFIWKGSVRKWSRASLTRSTLLMASATREYFSGLWQHFSDLIHIWWWIDIFVRRMLFIEKEAQLLDTIILHSSN